MQSKTVLILFLLLFLRLEVKAQDISIFQQFNGRYDYLAIGNTLNQAENNIVQDFCEILPSSQATLNIDNTSTIVAAYLYWAGSGLGDTEVSLNGTQIIADDTYTTVYSDFSNGDLTYFSCYAEVTNQILTEGNTVYTLADLDISETLANNSGYCNNRTNFAGWSLYVIYENNSLPLNQVNLFQGLEIINRNITEKIILLENVNVLDNDNAKIGFLAWEGDNVLNFGESLSINGNIISNPPLNMADNAFNGTNSFTNSSTFYNGDLDVYSIENNINVGDTQVEIKLTTGAINPNTGIFSADLIIVNNIITVLNSQLPDATIVIDTTETSCNSRNLTINYTVNNFNSTELLPANTPIAIYAEGQLIAQAFTENNIPINGYESGVINVTIPNLIPDNFLLNLVVDDDGFGNSTVIEILENNNIDETIINLFPEPKVTNLPSLKLCDIGFNTAIFNLNNALTNINDTAFLNFTFFENLQDLEQNENNILNPENYQSHNSPQTIFIRAEKNSCYDIFTFILNTENCPPIIPQGFSPNNDGINDHFNIQGLYTIFEKHELLIYSRYGNLIFKGNDNLKWYGVSNHGINKGKPVPTGTYFYVLKLNDSNYSNYLGWVYLNR
ncbi:gliding motility-associated-like protein [Lacinutrix venerupis]|uniref:gliding motility-associated C-terminal domain-containing protein n=1 Tax=Lacinutrix venerupis TaxID=1486034 RepID=UPI000EB21659|nr:gliding motility-associated C-terminal domain-containing protein [Lacinutrix venerupis]RLJ61132.1 gliding motility-associated-like protein [Lacinutrix venerupis]